MKSRMLVDIALLLNDHEYQNNTLSIPSKKLSNERFLLLKMPLVVVVNFS